MRIYLTHCSKEKSPVAKETGELYPPDELYTDPGIQQFMENCKNKDVQWAILSDKYGIFYPFEKHEYYEKRPSSVTPEEEEEIITQFNQQLADYTEIWFFIRRETFHPFYERVLKFSTLAERVALFDSLEMIE